MNIFKDFYVNRFNYRIAITLMMFRFANAVAMSNSRALWLICLPYMLFYRFWSETLMSIELRPRTQIGKNFRIDHGFGLVINENAKIGCNVHVRHAVTIGCKMLPNGDQGESPVIGDNVEIGAGAILLGDIKVGTGAKIGAGSVVVTDVPANATFVGNPAQQV